MPSDSEGPPLTIELVPSSAWASNLRALLPKRDWDRIRHCVYERARTRCEVCGGIGRQHPVECHEVWEYEDSTGVQRLVGLLALCPLCHQAKHFGSTAMRGHGRAAIAHIAKVNRWAFPLAQRYVDDALSKWAERSARKWTLDLQVLSDEYGIDLSTIRTRTYRSGSSDGSD